MLQKEKKWRGDQAVFPMLEQKNDLQGKAPCCGQEAGYQTHS